MSDRIAEWLEDIVWGQLLLGLVAFFGLFYLGLAYFDIRADSWTLPLNAQKLLTPLGITLLTFAAVVGGLVTGLVKERLGLD